MTWESRRPNFGPSRRIRPAFYVVILQGGRLGRTFEHARNAVKHAKQFNALGVVLLRNFDCIKGR